MSTDTDRPMMLSDLRRFGEAGKHAFASDPGPWNDALATLDAAPVPQAQDALPEIKAVASRATTLTGYTDFAGADFPWPNNYTVVQLVPESTALAYRDALEASRRECERLTDQVHRFGKTIGQQGERITEADAVLRNAGYDPEKVGEQVAAFVNAKLLAAANPAPRSGPACDGGDDCPVWKLVYRYCERKGECCIAAGQSAAPDRLVQPAKPGADWVSPPRPSLYDEAIAAVPLPPGQVVQPPRLVSSADYAAAMEAHDAWAAKLKEAMTVKRETFDNVERIAFERGQAEAAAFIAQQAQEIERLEAEFDRLRQDRADALSVTTREGLGASEWIARTGKAERERNEALARIASLEAQLAEAMRREETLAAALRELVGHDDDSRNLPPAEFDGEEAVDGRYLLGSDVSRAWARARALLGKETTDGN